MLVLILPNTIIKPGSTYDESTVEGISYDFVTDKLIISYIDKEKPVTTYSRNQFKILFDLSDKIQQYDYIVEHGSLKLTLVTCNSPFNDTFITNLGNYYTHPDLRFLDKISDKFYLNKNNNKIIIESDNNIRYILHVDEKILKLYYYYEYFGLEDSEPLLTVYKVNPNDKYPIIKYRNDKVETNVIKYLNTVSYLDDYKVFYKDLNNLKPALRGLITSLNDNYYKYEEYYVKDNISANEFINTCTLNKQYINILDIGLKKVGSKYNDILKILFNEIDQIAK